jgi:hypothetical protein
MRKLVLIIALLVVLSVIAFGQEEQKYTNESVARLSFLDGKTFVQRASDLGYEEGALNMPITEGDRLGTAEGRAEVFLGKGNYIRLDQNTKVDFLNLPKKGYDRIRLRVWAGNVYLNVNRLAQEKDIEVHTSDVSVYVLEKGLYRIDVNENAATEVMVFEGVLEAAGEEGSNMINAGQRAEIADGRFTSRPTRFVAAADDTFGQWNQSRDALLRKEFAQRHLTGDLEDYEGELDQYGTWSYLPEYGNVWIPGGIGPGWRPYYYGRWNWLPICGWTWMSYDPWGWAPYHYGRWGWNMGLGWYWMPSNIWGPAWVNWWWNDDYFGWAPLGFYGMPIVIIDNFYYDRWGSDRDYPWNSRALTVIHKNQLTAHDMSKIALTGDSLKTVGKISLTGDRMLAPRTGRGSGLVMEKLDGNRIMIKSPGREAGTGEVVRSKGGTTGGSGQADKTSGSTDSRKVIERSSGGTISSQGTTSSGTSSTPRKIRKKDEAGGFYPSASGSPSTTGSRDIIGYPSNRTTTNGNYFLERPSRFSSPFNRYYNSLSRGSSSSSPYSKYYGTSHGSSSSSSSSRTSSSSSSRGSSSSSRSSSSSSSSGGHVHKK